MFPVIAVLALVVAGCAATWLELYLAGAGNDVVLPTARERGVSLLLRAGVYAAAATAAALAGYFGALPVADGRGLRSVVAAAVAALALAGLVGRQARNRQRRRRARP